MRSMNPSLGILLAILSLVEPLYGASVSCAML